MSCNAHVERNFNAPIFTGNLRFLLGLLLMFVGFYIALLADFQGHGLGFFLVFAAPFVMFKDEENLRENRFPEAAAPLEN